MKIIPTLFLSPSTQEYNDYINGGNEEYYANKIADEMIPYLNASGIKYTRNDRNSTVGQSIRDSNAGHYGLHLAIHTNASPENLAGKLRGVDAYYYPTSKKGRRFADIIVNNMKTIYPDPNKVQVRPTTTLVEVVRTKAPTVLVEAGYHDNLEDADWIKANIESIAKVLALSVTEYFDVPFIEPDRAVKKNKMQNQNYFQKRY